MRTLSKLKHFYCLSSYKQYYYANKINGVNFVLHNAFCAIAEPLQGDNDISKTVDESPELPGWVKSSGENAGDDDEFVLPSVYYWIENNSNHVKDVDVKSIVNDIVENDIDRISKILKNQFKSPDLVVKALDVCDVDFSESLVEQLLRRFSYEWIPSFGFFKWAEMRKGIKHSPDIYNLMVDNLGRVKKFKIMWDLVEEMKELKGYITLDTMAKIMRRLAKAGKYDDAIDVFGKIELFGVNKDIAAMNVLIDALVKQGSVEHAERVYFEFKECIPPTTQTYNVLVHGWCRTRQIEKAIKTINEMKQHGFSPDSVTYTSFIEAYCREKDFRKVDATLEEMQKLGFHPSVVTYTIMMTALSKAKETDKALKVYEQMKQNNLSPDATFYNAFINALSQAGRLKDSDAVFEDMSKQGVTPGVATYNTLIFIAAKNLEEEKALNLLRKMEENRCKPDINTYAPLLKMCCTLKRMKVLSFLLNHMFKNDVGMDLGIYSLLVTRLTRVGKLDRACFLLDEMVTKGFVPMDGTYEILIKKLEKKGMDEEKQRVEELMSQARVGSGFKQSDLE